MQSSAVLALLAAAPVAFAQPCLLTYHAGSPIGGTAVYHAGRGQVLLVNTTNSNQAVIWAWNGAAWSSLGLGGPIARQGASVAYDVARDRIVLFGGVTSGSNYLPDTWEWDGAAWAQRVVAGPSNRARAAMGYDESRQRIVLFGGGQQYPTLRDTWEWDGQSWSEIPTSGPTPGGPGPMTYDSLRHRAVLLSIVNYQPTLWQWDGAQWSQSSVDVSGFGAWIAYDRPRDRLVLGGNGIAEVDPAAGLLGIRQPVLSLGSGAVFDIARSRVVIMGTGTPEYDGLGTAASPYLLGAPNSTANYSIGDTIALSVSAGGAEPLSYQWVRNGTNLSDDGRISGSHTPNLTIAGAVVADHGSYFAVVSNPCHSVSSGATTVSVRPACYVNCDGSTLPPILNVNDYVCFLNAYSAGDLYADCDQSSIQPILNVNDFICFTVRYSQGCP